MPTALSSRYALHDRIAVGGMATVHLGRLVGTAGFSRTVAIKRLHPHLLADPASADMLVDEARLAARIRHPNVVPTIDVLPSDGELLLVMEYVDGEALSQLFRLANGRVPLAVAVAIVSEMLHGLHAAHEAKSESGVPLGIVHRDVSPQNVLVGADGVARLVDFGIARAANRASSTGEDDVKGKLAYMAPEQLRREPVTRRTDVFAAGIVLWELVTGERLFAADNEAATIEKILVGWVAPPSSVRPELPPELDAIVLRALDPRPSERFATAREMAVALEDAVPRALGRDVGGWVEAIAQSTLRARRELVARIESLAGAPEPALPSAAEGPPDDEATHPVAFVRQLKTAVLPRAPYVPAAAPTAARRTLAVLAAATLVLAAATAASRIAPRARTAAAPTPVAIDPPSPAPSASYTAKPIERPVVAPPPARVAPAPAPAPVRRAARPAPTPCTAKYDPTTRKTTYVGDCG